MTGLAASLLIVDDEIQNRKLLETLLKPEGYLTRSVASGEEALAAIAERAPDLILMDIMMPVMDGFELTRILKASPATSHIPVIMVTASIGREARLAGLSAGAEDFLSKPVDRGELWLRVRNLLRLKTLSDFQKNHNVILERQVKARTVDLQRFRTAMEASGDGIVLVDRASMRYVDVNQTLCSMVGYTRQELLGMTPMDLFSATREPLEREYDAIIASNDDIANKVEGQYRHKDGSVTPIETRRRALHTDQGWIIVGTVRDITMRKAAEEKIFRLNRVYAMLSGINSAIVRIRKRGELFDEVCRLAVSEGGFMLARVIEYDADGKARIAATTESDSQLFQRIVDEYNANPGQSQSLLSLVLRSGQPMVSNDVASDVRIPNRSALTKGGTYALAVLPIVVDKRVAGAIILRAREAGAFNEDELSLLLELIGNISLSLEHFGKVQELHESERRFSGMLQNVQLASVMLDREARITFCNDYLLRLTGWRHEEIVGRNYFEVFIPSRIGDAKDAFAKLLANVPESWHRENEILTRAGDSRLMRWNNSVLRSAAGDVIGSASIGEDITEQRRAEVRIKRLNRVYAVLSGINTLIVRVHDREELFREACRIAVVDGGFRMAWIGIVGQDATRLEMVAREGGDQEYADRMPLSLNEGDTAGFGLAGRAVNGKKPVLVQDMEHDSRVLLRQAAGERGFHSLVMLPLMVSDRAVGALALYSTEIGFFDEDEMKLLTELAGDIAFAIDHIEKAAKLEYLAYYDALTGLANRTLFLERVSQYMRTAVKDGHKLALFMVDLERFKNINDSLGQAAGDALLKQVADWLTRNAGDAHLLARIGADHFALVLPVVKGDEGVVRLVEKTLAAFLEHPFRLDDAVLRIAAKVGAAMFPEDGAEADALLKNAEAALKKAKSGGDRFLFFKSQMTDRVAGSLNLENQLRGAFEKNEFVLHYQPKVSLASGKVTSAEALIRWNDPKTGLVPPGRFIPILEETGLINEVGRWALHKAVEDYLRWRDAGLAVVRIAVNVSPLQLRSRGFIAEVKQAISIDAHAAEGLELEITESLIMEDVKHSIATLQAIRAMGVTIAIDDFGTGFSSLSYLAKLPVDTLKIDRSFVVDMMTGPDGLALVSTIVNLAHSLKRKVVAEGVETEEQSRLLRLLGCDEMQGFLFSKPVPGETFAERYLAATAVA